MDFGTLLRAGKRISYSYDIPKSAKNNKGEVYSYSEIGNFIWYYVNVSGTRGFVKYTDIAAHTFTRKINSISYLYFLTSDFSAEHNRDGHTKILKYDQNKKAITDSLQANCPVDSVKIIDKVNWKNVDLLFRINYDSGDCGCMGNELFVVDANHKLDTLISSDYSLDDGEESYEEYSNIYLPINTSNHKIKFLLNGTSEYTMNPHPSTFRIYNGDLPKNINVDEKNMVVKSFHSFHYEFSKSRKRKKIPKVKAETYFFEWDGSKLKKL